MRVRVRNGGAAWGAFDEWRRGLGSVRHRITLAGMADRAKGMRALLKEGGSVRLARVPEPVIAAGDDVLVRVAFAGVCRTDLLVAEGRLPSRDPIVLGHELSGVVAAAGPSARARFGVEMHVLAEHALVGEPWCGTALKGTDFPPISSGAKNSTIRSSSCRDPRPWGLVGTISCSS